MLSIVISPHVCLIPLGSLMLKDFTPIAKVESPCHLYRVSLVHTCDSNANARNNTCELAQRKHNTRNGELSICFHLACACVQMNFALR